MLGDAGRIHLTEPLDYFTFVNLMRRCHLILTDSGGVQEEAPTLGKPLLVLRKLTERPEAFQAGLSKVVGNAARPSSPRRAGCWQDEAAYRRMVSPNNPFGDGRAAERIALAISRWAAGRRRCSSRTRSSGRWRSRRLTCRRAGCQPLVSREAATAGSGVSRGLHRERVCRSPCRQDRMANGGSSDAGEVDRGVAGEDRAVGRAAFGVHREDGAAGALAGRFRRSVVAILRGYRSRRCAGVVGAASRRNCREPKRRAARAEAPNRPSRSLSRCAGCRTARAAQATRAARRAAETGARLPSSPMSPEPLRSRCAARGRPGRYCRCRRYRPSFGRPGSPFFGARSSAEQGLAAPRAARCRDAAVSSCPQHRHQRRQLAVDLRASCRARRSVRRRRRSGLFFGPQARPACL